MLNNIIISFRIIMKSLVIIQANGSNHFARLFTQIIYIEAFILVVIPQDKKANTNHQKENSFMK